MFTASVGTSRSVIQFQCDSRTRAKRFIGSSAFQQFFYVLNGTVSLEVAGPTYPVQWMLQTSRFLEQCAENILLH